MLEVFLWSAAAAAWAIQLYAIYMDGKSPFWTGWCDVMTLRLLWKQ